MALDATPLLGRPTGIGTFTRGALRALASRGDLDVRAFAVSWRRRRGIAGQLPAGVGAHQRPMPARPLHALWSRADAPPLEWFIGPVDVVHGTNFVLPPARAAGVVSVHDLTPVRYPELCDAATLAYPGLIARALRRGAWVHADSAFVAGEIVEAFGADPGRVRVVNPGVPGPGAASGPAPGSGAALARLLPGGGPFCLAVGTAEPRKDLPGLVRAFGAVAARHPDLRLVLVGPPGWGEEALAAAVASSPARARIVRTGWLEEPEKAALLAQATVLAYPSVYEGFGFPPLEAMAAGVPVVATRAGSLPEVLGDAALLVDPGDPDGLAGALEACVEDEALRARLVSAGRAQASRYTWDRCGAGLAQLYRDATAARGGPLRGGSGG